jgi:hypothetical protein
MREMCVESRVSIRSNRSKTAILDSWRGSNFLAWGELLWETAWRLSLARGSSLVYFYATRRTLSWQRQPLFLEAADDVSGQRFW